MHASIVDGILQVSAGSFAVAISVKEIAGVWDALTHFPDARAAVELQGLSARMVDVFMRLRNLTGDGAPIDEVAEAERFARRHVELTRRAWAVESRCMSWFIVGPANFPTRANEKRQASRDRAYSAVFDHPEAALRAIERAAYPHGAPGTAIRMSNPDAPALIRAKIQGRMAKHSAMKAANVAVRAAKSDDPATLIEAVRGVTGWKLETCTSVVARGFQTFDLSGELAEIKRLQQRLGPVEAMRERGAVECVHQLLGATLRVVENPEAGRVQLVFSGKPDPETRALLKREGFRWAPSAEAWQRHLNVAGRCAAQRVVSALQKTAA